MAADIEAGPGKDRGRQNLRRRREGTGDIRRPRGTGRKQHAEAAGKDHPRAKVALRPGAIDRTRHLKPTLPELGENDIPIRDELDLELLLP